MRLVDDPDFTLHVGDVRERLRELPDESVNCVVTSPPYWGLRDYGTGEWEGGDADCDHQGPPKASERSGLKNDGRPPERVGQNEYERAAAVPYRDICGKCGARRSDRQLGLEATPEQYVESMVEVFREVRRVLRRDGTCWVNLGDSYANTNGIKPESSNSEGVEEGGPFRSGRYSRQRAICPPGLKPKDLVGIPWRVAFALQADGWYLRSDIVWSKPNPMPESVTDRPTKAHEYIFLLTRSSRYFYDADAVREPNVYGGTRPSNGAWAQDAAGRPGPDGAQHLYGNPAGRNLRSVWEIATEPYPEAHFATYPQALVERCLKAGCPEWVCRTCGEARRRIVETEYLSAPTYKQAGPDKLLTEGRNRNVTRMGDGKNVTTLGFTDCGHDDYTAGTVLDPFLGSGTTALVARRLGRRCVGIELSPEYAALAVRRLQQLSLFAGVA